MIKIRPSPDRLIFTIGIHILVRWYIYIETPLGYRVFPACARDQLMCADGSCIPDAYKCDGTADCPDNSDETNSTVCGEKRF